MTLSVLGFRASEPMRAEQRPSHEVIPDSRLWNGINSSHWLLLCVGIQICTQLHFLEWLQ